VEFAGKVGWRSRPHHIPFAGPAPRSAWRLSRSSIDHFIHKFVIGIFLNGSQTEARPAFA